METLILLLIVRLVLWSYRGDKMSYEKEQLIRQYEELKRQKEITDKDIARIEQILLSLDSYDIKNKESKV